MNTKLARLILVALAALAALTLLLMFREDPIVTAQDAGSGQTCDQLVAGLADAISDCQDINSNWACYGKVDASVFPVEFRFQALRDRRPLEVLNSIDIFDQGSVLMNLDVAGQATPIQAILFGPVFLNTVTAGSHDFLMRVDTRNMLCSDTPPGMVIRTQSGQAGHIKLNGVDFELHSAAFVTGDGRRQMTIVNLEGNITVTAGGVSQDVLVGQQTQLESANGQLQFTDDPAPSSFANSALLQWLVNDPAGLSSLQNTNKEETDQACASPIAFGDTIWEQTVNPGHECLFQFCGQKGDAVTVDMQAVDPALDPWVDLRQPNKRLLAFSNDIDEQNDDSLLCNVKLPVTSCDYTIVARSQRNRTAGAFNLTLDRQTACKPPVPRCEAVSRFGVELHEGPGAGFPLIEKLEPETYMERKQFSADRAWIEVEVETGGQSGWVHNDLRYVQCEGTTLAKQPVMTPQDTPTVTPQPRPNNPVRPLAPPSTSTSTPTGTSTSTPTSTPTGTSTSTPTSTPTITDSLEILNTVSPETVTPETETVTPDPGQYVTDTPRTPLPEATNTVGIQLRESTPTLLSSTVTVEAATAAPDSQPSATVEVATPTPDSQPPATVEAVTPTPDSQSPATVEVATPTSDSQPPATVEAVTPTPDSQSPATVEVATPTPDSQPPATVEAVTPTLDSQPPATVEAATPTPNLQPPATVELATPTPDSQPPATLKPPTATFYIQPTVTLESTVTLVTTP